MEMKACFEGVLTADYQAQKNVITPTYLHMSSISTKAEELEVMNCEPPGYKGKKHKSCSEGTRGNTALRRPRINVV
jgi:hypothetical protein